MKRKALGRNIVSCILLAVVIMAMSSCIKDNQDDCGLSVRFQYTYNIKDADVFPTEVKSVNLWLFDQDGKLLDMFQDSKDHFGSGYEKTFTGLKAGKYTLVCFTRDQEEADSKSFILPKLTVGVSTLKDLNIRLNRNADNTCNSEIEGLYNGTLDVDYSGHPQTVTVNLMKMTKRFRVIIMPYTTTDSLSADDFSLTVKDAAGWLDYKGDQYQTDSITYVPYSMETVSDPSATSPDDPATHAVVADMSTSRLFYDTNPRLVLKDKRSDKVILNLNLTWFLSLQDIGEHRSGWSDQEYLDRQDFYAVTFFVQEDIFMKTKVIVNGWTISLDDVDL